MSLSKLREYLRREGWLVAALVICVVLCMGLSVTADGGSEEEQRISRVLSAMEGAGQVEVVIYYADAIPCGAVVIADGASDMLVQLRLNAAVTTLLGLDSTRVAVYPSEGGVNHAQSR